MMPNRPTAPTSLRALAEEALDQARWLEQQGGGNNPADYNTARSALLAALGAQEQRLHTLKRVAKRALWLLACGHLHADTNDAAWALTNLAHELGDLKPALRKELLEMKYTRWEDAGKDGPQ